MFKYTIPKLIQWLFPSLTWKVKTRERKVYLTFDDGPHPTITPWVLHQLRQYNAKATFFCVGENVVKNPDTYKMVLDEGHQTGNHTFHHLNGWKTPNSLYLDNVEQCAKYVNSNLFRPPYGRVNFSQLISLKQRYRIIMWTVLTRDYDKNLDTTKALKNINNTIKAGSIVVLHDSEKAEKQLSVLLPAILEHFSRKGFKFEAL